MVILHFWKLIQELSHLPANIMQISMGSLGLLWGTLKVWAFVTEVKTLFPYIEVCPMVRVKELGGSWALFPFCASHQIQGV